VSGDDVNRQHGEVPDRNSPNAEPFVVRPVRPDEYSAVAELTVATYSDVLGSWLDEDYREELVNVAGRAEKAVVLVAVDESGALLGSVTYVPGVGPYAEFEGADEAGIRMLVVAPVAQGRGVGTALVGACVERARSAGRARVSLHTTPSMVTAQRLYQRLGFRRAPERDWLPGGLKLLGYVLDL
jgi:ribosomal protein S18 acetylase RimI-like enzyme